MGPARIIITALPSREAARALARLLVEERLAACVQLTAIESCYRWQDTIEQAGEIRLEAKTSAARAAATATRIAEIHPYELPEILTLAADASADYLAWIEADAVADH